MQNSLVMRMRPVPPPPVTPPPTQNEVTNWFYQNARENGRYDALKEVVLREAQLKKDEAQLKKREEELAEREAAVARKELVLVKSAARFGALKMKFEQAQELKHEAGHDIADAALREARGVSRDFEAMKAALTGKLDAALRLAVTERLKAEELDTALQQVKAVADDFEAMKAAVTGKLDAALQLAETKRLKAEELDTVRLQSEQLDAALRQVRGVSDDFEFMKATMTSKVIQLQLAVQRLKMDKRNELAAAAKRVSAMETELAATRTEFERVKTALIAKATQLAASAGRMKHAVQNQTKELADADEVLILTHKMQDRLQFTEDLLDSRDADITMLSTRLADTQMRAGKLKKMLNDSYDTIKEKDDIIETYQSRIVALECIVKSVDLNVL